ncbi:MAG TPA: isocitrate/isopropylmalate family dehydrogenase [Phycisphaerae bacterium]|nr:isocitrate/isopropylmalate family dehydrogenase [Phycisphaerae bacterium]
MSFQNTSWEASENQINLVNLIAGNAHKSPEQQDKVMGIFAGEGVGPEITQAAIKVLDAIEVVYSLNIKRSYGEAIGLSGGENGHDAEGKITQKAVDFCEKIFSQSGAIMCGPGGGRFVYDLRRRFDLFCKIVPLRPSAELHSVNRVKPDYLHNLDIVIVRDNAGGVYQGCWSENKDSADGCVAEQRFSYTQTQVERIINVAVRLSLTRKGRLHVIVKEGGVPGISRLWQQVARRVCSETQVRCIVLNADNAAYQLIQHPVEFDVIVTPNMVGDILADLGAVLLGSRGLSYSANYSAKGNAVYQTGHGAAFDLTGTDRANPAAQILSMAMMLRESFNCHVEASCIEQAIEDVWHAGWRTPDITQNGDRIVGTQRMGELIAEAVLTQVGNRVH